jgi:hypothetical protein
MGILIGLISKISYTHIPDLMTEVGGRNRKMGSRVISLLGLDIVDDNP